MQGRAFTSEESRSSTDDAWCREETTAPALLQTEVSNDHYEQDELVELEPVDFTGLRTDSSLGVPEYHGTIQDHALFA